MSSFDSTKTPLSKLLEQISEGKIQLPDFQRGWVWDDSHIRSLLVSVARSFPVGSIMLLETGGPVRFQIRPVEGVQIPSNAVTEHLILDGQQRLTSLTQVLRLSEPVMTRDEKKRPLRLHYYFDMEKALNGALEDSVFAVDEQKTLRKNFGRDVVLDLTTRELEFSAFCFPCSEILDSDSWEEGLMEYDAAKFARYMEFRRKVLNAFREYQVPVIELKKETSKEAVCLVFEKVNTGGMPLSVFELVTASYAADGFNLRDDWLGMAGRPEPGRHRRLAMKPLLRDLEPTDFLQGIALLHSYERRKADLAAKRTGKEVAAVSAKREYILSLPLDAYMRWAEPLTGGFLEADRFLRMEGFHHPRFLPYRSQVVPLAVLMVYLQERWLEPVIRQKLARWFWSGVFGELYGSAIETRIGLDVQDVLAWIHQPDAQEPTTVVAAGFQASRLDTLRSRTSAAYRGLYVLLQREGAQDFFWKARILELDRDECRMDIHHIFPRHWCEQRGIEPRVFNSIVNKTAISYKANRMIGGKAPSEYLQQIQRHAQVQLDDSGLDAIVATHLIDPAFLRADDFASTYEARKRAILAVVERAMGKTSVTSNESVASDEDDEEEDSE
jgi:hypothetical protein